MRFSRQEYWSGLPCPYPGESSRSRDHTHVSYVSCIGRYIFFLTTITTWETPKMPYILFIVYHVSFLTPQHCIIEIKLHEGKNFFLWSVLYFQSLGWCLAHGRLSTNTHRVKEPFSTCQILCQEMGTRASVLGMWPELVTGSHTEVGPTLGWMLWCYHLEIPNTLWTKSLHFCLLWASWTPDEGISVFLPAWSFDLEEGIIRKETNHKYEFQHEMYMGVYTHTHTHTHTHIFLMLSQRLFSAIFLV